MAIVDFSNYAIGRSGTFSRYDMIAPNEKCYVSITINNNSSKRITGIKYYYLNGYNNVASIINSTVNIEPHYALLDYVEGRTLRVDESISPNINAFTYMNSQIPKIRSLVINMLYVIVTFADRTQFTAYLNLPTEKQITMISGYWNPQIQNLAFKRCDADEIVDDEGEYVLTTLKTSFSSEEFKSRFGMIIKQYNADSGSLLQTITINQGDNLLEQMYSGLTDSNIFFNSFTTFSKEINYKIVVELGDNYEKSTLAYTVKAAYVNVHLSAALNGGVAFGKLSSSTDNDPKFECDYPSYFYDNIRLVGDAIIDNVRFGYVASGMDSVVAPGGQREVTVNYGVTYSMTPIVVVCPTYSTGTGNITCAIKTIGASSFTVVGTNNSDSIAAIGFTWIAYGQL